MIHPQGPEPGEYRGLSPEEQRRMNEMYRELNEWNSYALRRIAEIEAERKAHNQDSEPRS